MDEDNIKCVWCDSDLNLSHNSSTHLYVFNTYKCIKCDEFIIICNEIISPSKEEMVWFNISCNNLELSVHLFLDQFYVRKTNSDFIRIPKFELIYKPKDKFFLKLMGYLLFS